MSGNNPDPAHPYPEFDELTIVTPSGRRIVAHAHRDPIRAGQIVWYFFYDSIKSFSIIFPAGVTTPESMLAFADERVKQEFGAEAGVISPLTGERYKP
ncbi:MAG TPA: hypothetical protein VE967_05660 [Gemmatimonadaceae bacterium]|nr:hypothetical protein [Gemmatimonadaceae bacterium]